MKDPGESNEPFQSFPTVSPYDLDPRVQAWRVLKTEEALKELKSSVKRIELTLAEHRVCPQPGACVSIDKRLEVIEEEMAAVTSREHERGGAWKLAVLLAGVVSTGLTLAIDFFKK